MKTKFKDFIFLKKCFLFFFIFLLFLFLSFATDKDTLVIGSTSFNFSFDQYKYNHVKVLSINQHIFESLIYLDEIGAIKPLLAQRWINPDINTWIFYLRKDVFFHDGSRFTADDVIFSFKRVNYATDPSIIDKYNISLELKTIEKIDDFTVKIVTNYPNPTFLLKLRNCAIFPASYIEKVGFTRFLESPVGTGPYMNPIIVKENEKISSITMKRNEKYWGKKPDFKSVKFVLLDDEDTLFKQLIDQQIDILGWTSFNIFNKASNTKTIQRYATTGLRTNFLMINCKKEKNQYIDLPVNPFSDTKVRFAFYKALNIKKSVETILSSSASYANQIISPSVIGYNNSLPDNNYDLALAKTILKEANISSFSVKIHTSILDELMRKFYQDLFENLNSIGITFEVKEIPNKELVAIKNNGSFAIVPFSLSCGNSDALFILSTLLHSKDESWGSYNNTGFINTELDKIIEEAASTFDEQKRIELYKKAIQIAYNDAVFIPLYHPNVLMLAQKWLKLKVRSDERIYAFEITK